MKSSSSLATARRLLLLTALTGPLLLAGCANQAVTHSGFLKDYGQLSAAPDGAKALSYARAAPTQPVALRRVVVIDAIQIRLPAEQTADLSPQLVLQAQADFKVALENAFATRYQVVDRAPAEGAWHVRAAITGIKPSNPKLNAMTFLLVGPVSNGGVSTEAEVVDGVTGERVAAHATFTNGNLFNGGLRGYFDELGHVRKAFVAHAEKLRDLTTGLPAAAAASSAAAEPAQLASR